ncbi:MAG: phospho-N-acetylmuramoyl-pentapeptide-transferase [Acidimicrobiales bacterium]
MIALLIAGAVSFSVALLGSPLLMAWLRRHGIAQPIREDGPSGHVTKAGTPTMGGIVVVAGAVLAYGVAHVRSGTIFTRGGLVVVFAIGGAGLVGLLDDWIKVTRARSVGLTKRAKLAGLLVVATVFAVLALEWADVQTELSFTRLDTVGLDMGPTLWVVWAVVLILATANAVNLTDGLDGLAAGSALFSFAAYVVIAFWAFRHDGLYQIPQALDLAVVAASMVGACAGFLWWNAAPAQIFMGDTGSLAIGAGLAALALVTNTHLLLPILGGIFVVETLSVIVQVVAFRLFHTRVLRMAPIHHHHELGGWPETTVIVRYWILAGLLTAVALGVFYADYLSIPGSI